MTKPKVKFHDPYPPHLLPPSPWSWSEIKWKIGNLITAFYILFIIGGMVVVLILLAIDIGEKLKLYY